MIDTLGRRISKTVDGVTTYFVYDYKGNIIAEYEKQGSSFEWQRDYVYGGSGEAVYMSLPRTAEMNQSLSNLSSFCDAWLCSPYCDSNDLQWDMDSDNDINFVDWALIDANNFTGAFADNGKFLLTDFRGSVIGMADEQGSIKADISYDAWGNASCTGDLEGLSILWDGYYYDSETGNYYLRNRYYSPTERRFITDDPRGIRPDNNWNNPFAPKLQYSDGYGLKVYAGSDPINNSDPWGLLTIGTKIEMIFASRLFTGGIINRFRADEYTIHDDEGEMTAEFHKKMEDFYRDVVKANRPQIPPYYTTLEFPMPKPRGNWRFSNVEKLGSTGYWLHQAWDVEAEGSLEARCCKEKCWIRNRDIRWLWYDDIDANSYLQLIKTQHPMWYVPIEGSWDIIGDKLLNTDFKVKVLWQDNRANEKQIIPCFNKN